MKTGQYDIGFIQDADADRLVILDETGHFIGEDVSLGFCIDHILEQNPSKSDQKVVVNLSTSSVISDIAKKHNASILQTKIGETFVTQGIKENNAIVGGEGNGGVIYPAIGWGRDSLVGIVIALLHLAQKKQSVSKIVSTYPKYTLVREKIELSSSDQIPIILDSIKSKFEEFPQITEDGIKVMLEDSWIHVRPSNTEPIIRVFIESKSEEMSYNLIKKYKLLSI